MKRFADLNEQEVLALAISNEDEDNRIYRSFADAACAVLIPETADMYDKMAQEEIGHRDMLLELHRKKFGDFLPLIRRQDVKGFVARRPIWLNRPLGLDAARKFAEEMEYETARFYRRAAQTAHDESDARSVAQRLPQPKTSTRQLAHKLAEKLTPQARRCRGPDLAAHVRAAICAARTRRIDGRLGLDAGAAVRRGLRHAQHLVDVSGRPGRSGRRRHIDGLCRGDVRRRFAHRTRRAGHARRGLRRA